MGALSKMINNLKGLEHLAHKHNIQTRLYSGDGLDTLYYLLGDNYITRWFSTICDKLKSLTGFVVNSD